MGSDAASVLEELRALGNENTKRLYERRAPGTSALGVRFSDLDRLKKRHKGDHTLALALWDTRVLEARLLAAKVEDPAQVTPAQAETWAKQTDWPYLADSVAAVVYRTRFWREKLAWTAKKAEFVQRAGWSLLHDAAADPRSGLTDGDLLPYLERIEAGVHQAPNWAREAMNLATIAIGLRSPALKERALAAARAYGKVDVFHGDGTNCKIWDAVAALEDPRTKVKVGTP